MLLAEDVRVRFGAVAAVDGIAMSVPDAGVVGLAGPNGSGKSTLLNAICGLVPAQGRLTVDGRAVPLGKPLAIRRAGVLRTYQTPQLVSTLTCLENVLLGDTDRRGTSVLSAVIARPMVRRAERERWERAHASLEWVGLAPVASTPIGSLPYGTRRLVELARAVNADPKVILLDEPSAGLNDAETGQFAALLRALPDRGISLLIVDHKIDFLDSLCREIVVLMFGQVIAKGSPAEVWADQRVADAYLGVHDVDG